MRRDRSSLNPEALPVVGLLTEDAAVTDAVNALAGELGFVVDLLGPNLACIVDPAVGVERVQAWCKNLDPRPSAAVLLRPGYGAATLLAFRRTKAALLPLPQDDVSALRLHLETAVPGLTALPERRGYPRAPASGVRVLHPSGISLVDISPYGALVEAETPLDKGATVTLELGFARHERTENVTATVAARVTEKPPFRCRLRFQDISEWAQREIFKIVKAHLLATTVHATVERAKGALLGYRRIDGSDNLRGFLGELAAGQAGVTFAALDGGRPMHGKLVVWNDAAGEMSILVQNPSALGAVGDAVRLTATAGRDVLAAEATIAGLVDMGVTLAEPTVALRNDNRAERRLEVDPAEELVVLIDHERFVVTDVSPNGCSFLVPEGSGYARTAGFEDARFLLGHGVEHFETVRITGTRPVPEGRRVGAGFMGTAGVSFRGVPIPLVEEEFSGAGLEVVEAPNPYFAERVVFGPEDQPIVGLWNEVEHPGPRTVVIVPPAWGRTKESSSLLAQFLAASFDANRRHVGVLRLDYRNARGESHKDPEFRAAGRETLGFKGSVALEDIRHAIDYATQRTQGPDHVALVGMSFSGPLCLRVAGSDSRVTRTVLLMGASDMQDLIRNASGGVDFIANYQAGVRIGLQNLLGVLSNVDLLCGDATQHDIADYQDALQAAGEVGSPVTWIAGQFDGFINADRVRAVLDRTRSLEKRLVLVPCGHVPSRTSEALASFVPVFRALSAARSVTVGTVAVPAEATAAAVMATEWANAPRMELAAPASYWRDYMLGSRGDLSLGYEILAMTREYRTFMQTQAALLDLRDDAVLADIGCGLGHSMDALLSLHLTRPPELQLYDVAPEILTRANARASELGFSSKFTSTVWDAASAAPPHALGRATHVLLSLFLSTLPDPERFLETLASVVAPGTRVVASTMRPDADLSPLYAAFMADIERGVINPPNGKTADFLLEATREYMGAAAQLLRHAEEGRFLFFTAREFRDLFRKAGYRVVHEVDSFGPPYQAHVLVAVR